MRRLRTHVVAVAVLLAATFGMFGDVLLAGDARLLSHDGDDLAQIFLYWQDFTSTEMRQGRLPFWNPHVYSGVPFLAGFQPALLYPPSWIGLPLSPVCAINVGIALHVFLAGLWVYVWTSRRRLHPAARVFAALVFMFCGAHTLQIYRGHLPNLRTLAWAPLVLASIDGALDTRRGRWVLVGMAAVAAQILAGHIQETYYTGLVAGAYALVVAIGRRQVGYAIVAVGMMYAGGALLAAAQLFPGIDAARETIRSLMTYEIASSFAFPPENVTTLVLPGLFGDLVTTPYWGRWTLSEMCLFVGVAPFVLALYGARAGAPEVRRYSLAFAIGVLVLACGYYTPVYQLLYDYLPAYRNFRGTTKFAFLASLFVVMLAAVGFDEALRAPRLPRWPAVVAAATGILLLGASGTVHHTVTDGSDGWWLRALIALKGPSNVFLEQDRWGPEFIVRAGRHAAVVLAVGGGTFLLVAATWHAARQRRAARYALALLGVAEVFTYARYSRVSFDPSARLHQLDLLREFRAEHPGDYRILSDSPYRAMSGSAFDVDGGDPMLSERYAEFLGVAFGVEPQRFILWPLITTPRMLGMLRCRWVVQPEGSGLRYDPTGLRELPRAFLVTRWQLLPDTASRLDVLRYGRFDPTTTVLLETAPDPAPDPSADPARLGTVRVVDRTTDALEIEAELTAPAILVLTDGYAGGWRARAIDAAPQPAYAILPADHTLRALPLAAGRHHLLLEYRPPAFAVGVGVSAVALVAYAAALILL